MTTVPEACERGGLIAPASAVARELFCAGYAWWHLSDHNTITPEPWIDVFRATRVDVVAYMPWRLRRRDSAPDLEHARAVFAACRAARIRHVVVVSSRAARAGTGNSELGTRNWILTSEFPVSSSEFAVGPLAQSWRVLEWTALSAMGFSRVTVLRAGEDPIRETPANLVLAIGRAMRHRRPGTFTSEFRV